MEVPHPLEVPGPGYNAPPLRGMDMSLNGPNLENSSISLSILYSFVPIDGSSREYYPPKVIEDFSINFSET